MCCSEREYALCARFCSSLASYVCAKQWQYVMVLFFKLFSRLLHGASMPAALVLEQHAIWMTKSMFAVQESMKLFRTLLIFRLWTKQLPLIYCNIFFRWSFSWLRQDPPPPPLEAILVIFGRRALIFFCLKALGKKWKMKPLLCACAVVITLETQKCRKRAPRSVEFNFFTNCDRHKRFSQNERRRADLQNVASDFLIFAQGLSYDLSKFSDIFTPFFDFERP